MKKRMARILTLFMAASMAATPSMSVLAQTVEGEQQIEAGLETELANETTEDVSETTEDVTASESQTEEQPAEEPVPEVIEEEVNETDETTSEQPVVETETAVVENPVTTLSFEIDGERFEDGSYDIELESSSKMFKILEPKATIQGDKLLVSFYNESSAYDKIYFGKIDDAVKDEEKIVKAAVNGTRKEYEIEVPLSWMGQKVEFLPGKPDDTWGGTQYYLTIPTVITEPELTYEDGDYEIAIESGFKMFKIDAASQTATVKDGKITVSFQTTSNSYDKFYFGTPDELEGANIIQGTKLEDAEGYQFTFTLSTSKMGQTLNFVPGKTDGTWYTKKQYTLTIPDVLTESEPEPSEPDQEETPEPTPTPTIPSDGQYSTTVESSASMFKVVNCILTVKDGKLSAVITLSGTGYDYLYMGTAADAANASSSQLIPFVANENGEYTYSIPVESLDTPISVAAHSSRNNTWYDRQLTFKSEDLSVVLNDGQYSVDVESSASMFKVIDCILTSKAGKMIATITLSGTGYDYLFVGTTEEAAKADQSALIPFVEDANGKYTYTMEVSALDTPITIAAHSLNRDTWYERMLTFKSDTAQLISGDTSAIPDNNDQTTAPDMSADSESKYESDTSGSTSKVDSSTTLADGVYSPDRFSWSGGSGRASISCPKVTVKNGQAFATIVFNSENYAYVKANGNKYYGTKGGGTTTFVIPVELNKNNRIIGMTTAMSAAHEVTYNIFVYIAAAAGGSAVEELNKDQLSEEAPEIMGLELESETEVKYAELFKIFNYQDGITLLEVDTTKYTANEDDETAVDDEDAAVDSAETVDGEEVVESSADKASELYKNKVVRYLIVPENVEIPVGLDEEMIIVQLPVENAYVASDKALNGMKDLSLLDVISAVGIDEEDIEIQEIIDAMKSDDEEKKILFAGKAFEPEYKTLVEAKTDLAILPGTVLPLAEDASGEELTEEEQENRLTEITERMATLGIPVIYDRSADEKTDLAQAEWIKFYGALFGQREDAQKLFDAVDKEAE